MWLTYEWHIVRINLPLSGTVAVGVWSLVSGVWGLGSPVRWLLCPVVTWHLKRPETRATSRRLQKSFRYLGALRSYSGVIQELSCWKTCWAPILGLSTPNLLMCHSPDASHIIMADVLPNEALSRILGSSPVYPEIPEAPTRCQLPFCALSWLSDHACILFFMHYHVTVCLLLFLWRLRRLSLLFMLYLYLYALPGRKTPYNLGTGSGCGCHTAYASCTPTFQARESKE